MNWLDGLKEKLRDERGRKVVFLSHCLLNQNTRYLGGASCPGAKLSAVSPLLDAGLGIIQLPCPEIAAWGGIDKPLIWLPLSRGGKLIRFLAPILRPLFTAWTRRIYQVTAGRAARQIRACLKAGQTVAAFVGIDGSPSCGVKSALDLRSCFEYNCRLDPETLSATSYNDGLYSSCARPGPGMFTQALRRRLCRMKIDIPFEAHDLAKDLGLRSVRDL
jgi:uncharacterized protein YbbK (DUF523 family)